MSSFLAHELFNIPNCHAYPPFKNGLYMEEYFINKYNKEKPKLKRVYIPVKWTNFQIQESFKREKNKMQNDLDEFIKENPSINGYFTIVQYDDGPLLKLPENTIIYGACSNDIPLPLIYEDTNNTLENFTKKSFNEKTILCSFVGTITHPVRQHCFNCLHNRNNFTLINSGSWTPSVTEANKNTFVDVTLNSKFALAPRGYGLQSFRLYEIFLLGTIPIYVYDNEIWTPYKDILDYSKFCIIINVKDINNLEKLLLNIDETKYNNMLNEYQKVKDLFTLDGMYNYIVKNEQ